MAASALPPIRVGTRLTDFGTFDLTVQGIAEGGVGLVVWGANRPFGGQIIAAKLLRPDHAGSESYRAAFEREALIWCHVWPHHHVIAAQYLTRLYGNYLPVLLLEYASGGTIRQALIRARQSGHALDLEVAFGWSQQLASALAHLHTPDPDHERPLPLVHADLKPENVLLDQHSNAYLTDLGLSRALASVEDDTPLTSSMNPALAEPSSAQQEALDALRPALAGTNARIVQEVAWQGSTRTQRLNVGRRGAVVGTPPYMPPEQWAGIEAVVPKSDVYALGVLLYELFAGIPGWPHQPRRPDREDWQRAHEQGERRRLSEKGVHALEAGPLLALVERGEQARAAAVLTGVGEVIEVCLEREASRRPTAEAVQRRMGELAEQAGGRRLQILPYERTPEHEAAFWDCLAGTFGSLGQYEEYLRLMKRVVQMRPEDPLKWLNLGHAFFRLKRYEEAWEASLEAESRIGAERMQWRIILYNHQGDVLDEMGRQEEAVRIYQRALELDPLNASAWQNIAIAYWKWAQQAETGEQKTRLLEGLRATEQALHIEASRQNSLQLRQMFLEALGQLEERRES